MRSLRDGSFKCLECGANTSSANPVELFIGGRFGDPGPSHVEGPSGTQPAPSQRSVTRFADHREMSPKSDAKVDGSKGRGRGAMRRVGFDHSRERGVNPSSEPDGSPSRAVSSLERKYDNQQRRRSEEEQSPRPKPDHRMSGENPTKESDGRSDRPERSTERDQQVRRSEAVRRSLRRPCIEGCGELCESINDASGFGCLSCGVLWDADVDLDPQPALRDRATKRER